MNNKRLTGLTFAALLASTPAMADSTWTLGAGVEADNVGAHTTAADVSWSPNTCFTFGAGLGATRSDEEQGDFNGNNFSIDGEWWPMKHLGLSAAYNKWEDAGSYEKNTSRATLFVGGKHARIGLIGEAVESQTTIQLQRPLRDRESTLDYNGGGFGGEIKLYGDHAGLHVSFMSYSYDDSTARLVTFLNTPSLSSRPRLEQLTHSALTVADALLDRSASLGAELYFGERTVGLNLAQYRELLTGADTTTATVDVSWPVTGRWNAAVTFGISDSEANDTTVLLGGRVSVRSL